MRRSAVPPGFAAWRVAMRPTRGTAVAVPRCDSSHTRCGCGRGSRRRCAGCRSLPEQGSRIRHAACVRVRCMAGSLGGRGSITRARGATHRPRSRRRRGFTVSPDDGSSSGLGSTEVQLSRSPCGGQKMVGGTGARGRWPKTKTAGCGPAVGSIASPPSRRRLKRGEALSPSPRSPPRRACRPPRVRPSPRR